jgi:hypothetical protein
LLSCGNLADKVILECQQPADAVFKGKDVWILWFIIAYPPLAISNLFGVGSVQQLNNLFFLAINLLPVRAGVVIILLEFRLPSVVISWSSGTADMRRTANIAI